MADLSTSSAAQYGKNDQFTDVCIDLESEELTCFKRPNKSWRHRQEEHVLVCKCELCNYHIECCFRDAVRNIRRVGSIEGVLYGTQARGKVKYFFRVSSLDQRQESVGSMRYANDVCLELRISPSFPTLERSCLNDLRSPLNHALRPHPTGLVSEISNLNTFWMIETSYLQLVEGQEATFVGHLGSIVDQHIEFFSCHC